MKSDLLKQKDMKQKSRCYQYLKKYIFAVCASHYFPISNVFIDRRLSCHVRKILYYLLSCSELNMTDSLSKENFK